MRQGKLPRKKEARLALPILQLNKGFTLFELSIAIAIYALAACGILSLFISSATQAESAGNISRAINVAREELENTVRSADFESLATYSKLPPNIPAGMSLVCYVGNHPIFADLRIVRIVVSYREKSNRIVGEDTNLNGALNTGEDRNNDNRLTSPCELSTFIARRE